MVQNNCIVELQRDAYVKDLGVIFDEKLNFRQHIFERINKAYSMLWLIKRNFQHIGPAAFVLIYKHLVRSHLEYILWRLLCRRAACNDCHRSVWERAVFCTNCYQGSWLSRGN